MIQEVYVSFEVAKLLKEKGFDEPIKKHYYENGVLSTLDTEYLNWNLSKTLLSAPTHQMALAWLREKGIYITIIIDDDSDMSITYNIDKKEVGKTIESVCHHHGNYYPLQGGYEEAVEAALKYSLENLI